MQSDDPEKAKQQAWKKAQYDRRQQEDAAKQEREAKRLEYLKAHDRPEYDKHLKEEARREERKAADKEIKQDPKNRWAPEMTDHARAAAEQARARDGQENDRGHKR